MVVEIIPDLWLGNKETIENYLFLKEKKVDCMINVTRDLGFNERYKNCETIRIPVDNNFEEGMLEDNIAMYKYLEEIVTIIHKRLNKNKVVLVYCVDGKQRSATIIAGYIIKYGKVGMKQSIEYMRTKEVECFRPNINFAMTLKKFESGL